MVEHVNIRIMVSHNQRDKGSAHAAAGALVLGERECTLGPKWVFRWILVPTVVFMKPRAALC